MFFSHQTLLECRRLAEACTEGIEEACEQQICSRMLPAGDPKNWWPVIWEWFLRLPDAEKMEKIRVGFARAAKKHRAEIAQLHWWDIDLVKRHLMVTVLRSDGTHIPVLFMWKKRRDFASEKRVLLSRTQMESWSWDPVQQSWRCDFEGETYDHVKELFLRWLSDDLPAVLPNGTPFPYRRESSVSALNGHS